MSQETKTKRWPELGLITKNSVKDKDGNVMKDKAGNDITRLGFKLNDDIVEILRKGGLDIGQYGILTTPVDEVESLYKAGQIEEDKIEKRRQVAKDAHTWLRYKVQLPPPRVKEE